MRIQNITISLLTAIWLLGCSKEPGSVGGGASSTGIEGTYVDVDNPDISLIIKGGQYQQGGSDVHLDGTYTARKINDTSYELDVVYSGRLAGEKGTVTIRREAEFLIVTHKDIGSEAKFKRK